LFSFNIFTGERALVEGSRPTDHRGEKINLFQGKEDARMCLSARLPIGYRGSKQTQPQVK